MNVVRVIDLVAQNVLRVEDGNHGEYRPRPDEFVEHGTPFIRAADMTSGTVAFNSAGKVNDVARRRIRKGVGAPGDVLLSHKGTVGKVAVAPPDAPDYVCSPQTTFWRSLDHDVIDPRYLKFVIVSEPFQQQLDVLKGQTDMAPYVSLTDQRSIEIVLPSISEQRAIAEVLGALDDKIAANGAVSHRADELAASIFGQWRCGDREHSTYDEVATIRGGGTPKTTIPEYWGGHVPWATPTDATALSAPYLWRTARTVTEAGLNNCSSPLYPTGSILMTSRATIGAFAIAEVETAVNQGFIVVNAVRPDLQWWLFHDMQSRVEEFVSHANGATFLELPRGRFKNLPVTIPPPDAAREFSARVSKLHTLASQVMQENETLAVTRDTLLPLLMSGRLTVKDAEKTVEEVL